ncbi:hypothetical protein BDZ89DRAFT_1177055 [Hymenopellis radicata]|nr:hypothetical protein BDZ89DRAFT_1177055 [Hymenopellis radicata]
MSLPPSCLPPATCPARLLHFCRLGVFSVFYNGFNENDFGSVQRESSRRRTEQSIVQTGSEFAGGNSMSRRIVEEIVFGGSEHNATSNDDEGQFVNAPVPEGRFSRGDTGDVRDMMVGTEGQSTPITRDGQGTTRHLCSQIHTRPGYRLLRALRIATWSNYGEVDFEQRGSARRRGLGVSEKGKFRWSSSGECDSFKFYRILKLVSSLTTTMEAAAAPPPRYAYLHADGTGLKLLELERPSPAIRAASAVLAGPAFFFKEKDQTDLISDIWISSRSAFLAAFGTLTGTSFRYNGSSDAPRLPHCGYNTVDEKLRHTRNNGCHDFAVHDWLGDSEDDDHTGASAASFTRGRLRRRLAALLFGDLEHF